MGYFIPIAGWNNSKDPLCPRNKWVWSVYFTLLLYSLLIKKKNGKEKHKWKLVEQDFEIKFLHSAVASIFNIHYSATLLNDYRWIFHHMQSSWELASLLWRFSAVTTQHNICQETHDPRLRGLPCPMLAPGRQLPLGGCDCGHSVSSHSRDEGMGHTCSSTPPHSTVYNL